MEKIFVQKRIKRITYLLERLEEIPDELESIHEELYKGALTPKRFDELINQRSNLLVEKRNKRKELQMMYRAIGEK